MRSSSLAAGFLWVLLVSLTGGAHAQVSLIAARPYASPQNLDVKTMSFDLWCQETQGFPVDRCDARRPADVVAFEDFRAVIERFELEFLRQREEEAATSARRNFDPTDNQPNPGGSLGGR